MRRLAVAALVLGVVVLSGGWTAAVAGVAPAADARSGGIPDGGAVLYGIGLGDGGPALSVAVGADGQMASADWPGYGRFGETVLGANAGLVVVRRGIWDSHGQVVRSAVLLREPSGRILRKVKGVPTGPNGCNPEVYSGAPMWCWPLPDRRSLIRLSPAGTVSRINLDTGRSRRLARINSTWPDERHLGFGGAMSVHSTHLYVSDDGKLTTIDVNTGAKTVVAAAVGDDHWFDLIPFCATSTGRVLVKLAWWEGDPGMPPMGIVEVDPTTGTYQRLITFEDISRYRGVFGCTANGRNLIIRRDYKSQESWATVSAADGSLVGGGGEELMMLDGPYVDNGVGR